MDGKWVPLPPPHSNSFFSLSLSDNAFSEVLASPLILNLPGRVDWRACLLTKDQETKLAEKFRAEFAPFDFTGSNDDDTEDE